MDRHRTLVSAYCFPPYSDTAGVVAAKRVRERGERVDVVTVAMDRMRRTDPSLSAICGHLVDRYAVLQTPSAFASWRSVSTYAEEGASVATRWEDIDGPYREVYSRAHFAASHFLAASLRAARPDLRWTAEFSDPLSHDVAGRVRHVPVDESPLLDRLRRAVQAAGHRTPTSGNLFEWCEVMTFAMADRVVFTNDRQRDFMLSRVDVALADEVAAKCEVSAHPTLPRSFYDLGSAGLDLTPGRTHIGYFGNLYASRGLDMVLRALAALDRRLSERLQLHVFTSDPAPLRAAVQDLGIAHCTAVHPFLPFLDFLNAADQMDVLLLQDAQTPAGMGGNPFLPSKWSDYRGTTSRIWAVTEEGSTLHSIGGFAFESPVGHFTATLAVLARLAHQVRERP